MRRVAAFFAWAVGLGFALGTSGIVAGSLAAAFGFAHPLLDAFNHLQPLLFAGTLGCLSLAPVFVRPRRLRAFVTTLAGTGFAASAVVVVAEAVPRFETRPPLPGDGRPVYTLMTHNLFGLNGDMARVWQAVQREDPDIVLLQEYFPYQRSLLHPLMAQAYPHHTVCVGGKRANIAVYARIPFAADEEGACNAGFGDDAGRISRIAARFEGIDGVPFTIVTTHLDWPVQVSQLDEGASWREGLDLAVARKQGQFTALADALTTLPGPLMVAGDFNSTSWSHVLRRFTEVSGLERQDHSFLTYPTQFYIGGWREVWPFLPLDHVMTRGGMVVHDLHKGAPAGSDHNSVVATFSLESGGAIVADGSD